MNLFQKIGIVWQKVSLVQRALLIAIVLTFIVIGVLLTNWARRPDMRMLYQQLSPEEAPLNPLDGSPRYQLLTPICGAAPLRQAIGRSSKSSK